MLVKMMRIQTAQLTWGTGERGPASEFALLHHHRHGNGSIVGNGTSFLDLVAAPMLRLFGWLPGAWHCADQLAAVAAAAAAAGFACLF